MGSARNLWIAFGVLIALLVGYTSAILVRVSAIDREIRAMADARNFSAAAVELERDTLRYMLNLRTYLHLGDARTLELARQAAKDVEHHLLEYRRLRVGDRRYEIAAQFDPLWRELFTLGQMLAGSPDAGHGAEPPQRFLELGTAIQALSSQSMQVDALAVYNRHKDEALRDVERVLRFALVLVIAGTLIALAISTIFGRRILAVERRLRSQRETLQLTLGSIAQGVITTDTAGRVTYLNAVAESLCGWRVDEARGHPLHEVYCAFDEVDRQPILHRPDAPIPSQTDHPLESRLVLVGRNGVERPVDESAAAIRDDRGAVMGVVVVFRDVSRHRALERELRQQAQDLASADRNKTEFLAMLAHELRNPLSPIVTAAQVLRARIADAPMLQPAVAVIERQSAQMVRLVDDLMDISRISRGQIGLRLEPTDLKTALQVGVESVSPLLDSLEHDLVVRLPPDPVVIEADRARVAQIVGNLVHNAAKFTPRGGRIVLEVEADADEVRLTVSDNGIGIEPDHLPYVFDPYMQAQTSLARSSSGVGLGLALVQSLVQMHGGSVSAHSAGVGKGSTFVVRFARRPAVCAGGHAEAAAVA